MLDPLDTLTFVAARTKKIFLGTSVLDIPYYNPVTLARRLTTIDYLSNGRLRAGFGLGWSKALSFHTGQTPVVRYNRQLMNALLHDRLPIAEIVNAQVISLEDAASGYQDFDKGAAAKYVLDPHGMLARA